LEYNNKIFGLEGVVNDKNRVIGELEHKLRLLEGQVKELQR
jgi:hypothetical protein